MPLVRDLHPEFGYLGSLHVLGRKLRLVLVFVGFGVLAGISGLAVFMADEQPDPRKAMALAPADALSHDLSSVATGPADAALPIEPSQKAAETASVRPPCQESTAIDCAVPRMHRRRLAPAANERPAIAAVPIGRVDPPPVAAPAEAAPVAPAPDTAEASNAPADIAAAAPAAEAPAAEAPTPPPPPAARKPRPRSQQVQHRERDEPRRSYGSYGSGPFAGYARVN